MSEFLGKVDDVPIQPSELFVAACGGLGRRVMSSIKPIPTAVRVRSRKSKPAQFVPIRHIRSKAVV